MTTEATVGRTVLYQTDERGGLRYALPAVVVCTRDSHPGEWSVDPRAEHTVPVPQEGHVHLVVFTPGRGHYTEHDVPFDEIGAPRSWRWPTGGLPAEHPDARGTARETGQSIPLIVIAAFVALVLLIGGSWAFRYYTADLRGKIAANEQIKANPATRIEAYERFFNLCASVQSTETTLAATRDELATTKDERRRGQLLTNVTALTAARADAVNQYNADARKGYTAGQFRSSNLPFELSTTTPTEGTTTCAA